MAVFSVEAEQQMFTNRLGVSDKEFEKLHQKSLQSGVMENSNRLRFRIPGKMLERLLSKNLLLINLFNKHEMTFSEHLCFSHIFILTDANGVILSMCGNQEAMDRMDIQNNLGLGSSLSFSSAGTNPVSVSMELNRSVFIANHEFYLDLFPGMAGLSMPLKDAENNVMAYLSFYVNEQMPVFLIYPFIDSVARTLELEYRKKEEFSKPAFFEETLEEKLKKYKLTNREKEIALYWMLDYDYKQISKALQISQNTVRAFVTKINSKMQVNSKASLILKVIGAI